MTIRILTVCTGNICRSPLAAQLLEANLSREIFRVQSAGTAALEDTPMPEPAQKIAAGLGLSTYRDHRGKQLLADEVAQADVVLAMARKHRQAVAVLHPPAVRYVYTLTEFAHIALNIPETSFAEMVQRADVRERGALEAVSRLRGVVQPLESQDALDIDDPYGRSLAVYERSSAEIVEAVNTIVGYFDLARGPLTS